MAGNSERRGAKRNPGSKKGQTVGSGAQRRKQLKGKGPTPKADRAPEPPGAPQGAGRGEARDVVAGGRSGGTRSQSSNRSREVAGGAGVGRRPQPGGRGAARQGAGHRAVRSPSGSTPTTGSARR